MSVTICQHQHLTFFPAVKVFAVAFRLLAALGLSDTVLSCCCWVALLQCALLPSATLDPNVVLMLWAKMQIADVTCCIAARVFDWLSLPACILSP